MEVIPRSGMSSSRRRSATGRKALEIQQWFAAKFDRQILRDRLAAAFGAAPVTSSRLADAWVRLAITAYDAETDTPKVYQTPHSRAVKPT